MEYLICASFLPSYIAESVQRPINSGKLSEKENIGLIFLGENIGPLQYRFFIGTRGFAVKPEINTYMGPLLPHPPPPPHQPHSTYKTKIMTSTSHFQNIACALPESDTDG